MPFSLSGIKLALVAGAALLLVSAIVGVTVHLKNLARDSAAYQVLRAEHQALAARYGCEARPANERELAACLAARERDGERAKAEAEAKLRAAAAEAQAKLERAIASLQAEERRRDELIDSAPAHDDGAVPKILLDAWARERAARGLK